MDILKEHCLRSLGALCRELRNAEQEIERLRKYEAALKEVAGDWFRELGDVCGGTFQDTLYKHGVLRNATKVEIEECWSGQRCEWPDDITDCEGCMRWNDD